MISSLRMQALGQPLKIIQKGIIKKPTDDLKWNFKNIILGQKKAEMEENRYQKNQKNKTSWINKKQQSGRSKSKHINKYVLVLQLKHKD